MDRILHRVNNPVMSVALLLIAGSLCLGGVVYAKEPAPDPVTVDEQLHVKRAFLTRRNDADRQPRRKHATMPRCHDPVAIRDHRAGR